MSDDLEYELTDTEPPLPNGYVAFVWERWFLNAFIARFGTISQAAEYAGVTETMVEARALEAPEFAANLELCRAQLRDTLRHEAIRRALEPERVPIIYRGRVVEYVEKYDNRHLEWLLERLLPEEFHLPSKIDSSGGDGETVFKLELRPGGGRQIGGSESSSDQ